MNEDEIRTYTLLKRICRNAFLTGVGDFWYESKRSSRQESFYKVYRVLVFTTYYTIIISLILNGIWGDVSKEDRDGAITVAVSMTTMMTKVNTLLYNRELATQVNRDIVKVCGGYERNHVLKKQYKRTQRSIVLYFFVIYLTIALYVLDGIIKSFNGQPFVTIQTYWPKHDDGSTFANLGRILINLLWIKMMAFMIWTDSIVITNLIVMGFKFVTLREHFEQIRIDYDETPSSVSGKQRVARLKEGFIQGIAMHRELLRLISNIHTAFGPMISIQVCQSFVAAVLMLLKLASSAEHSFTAVSMQIFFVASLFTILALYMLNAGDITYEASLLPNAMFYCGWHLNPVEAVPHRDLRRLVALSCARAQRPVLFRAFGVQELSYETYLAVARHTYSVFAVFYRG